MFEQRLTREEIKEYDMNPECELSKEHARFSPLIAPTDELIEMAYDIVEIIDENHRKTLVFNKYLVEKDIDFVPECATNDNMLLDIDTCSKQTGKLDYETYLEVLKTKNICSDCPLMKQCLAISMTTPRLTRTSKNEKSIPRH